MIKKLLLVAALLFTSLGQSYAQFADQATYAGAGAGTANAQTITVPNAASLADLLGVIVKYVPAATNTGDTTLTVNGFGSPPHVRKATSSGLVTLTGNELVNGVPVAIMYNGTYFVIMSAATASLPSLVPQGYLTPCKLTSPVSGCTAGVLTPTGDVSAATNLYYEPAFGDGVPIYDGTNFVNFLFSEMTLVIPSSRLANTIYDVCIFNNGGTPAIGFSVAWSTSSAGSGARGSGAGTAEITQVQGIWTNAVSASVVNGATTTTVAANQCTIVATVLIDGTNGQVSFTRTWGQSRKWAAWNFYNRLPITLQGGDSTGSWNYNTSTFRQSNNSASNTIAVLIGLQQEQVTVDFTQNTTQSLASGFSAGASVGVGWNSTTVASGVAGLISATDPGAGSSSNAGIVSAKFTQAPVLGLHNVNMLEKGSASGGSANTFDGGNANMLMSVQFRG